MTINVIDKSEPAIQLMRGMTRLGADGTISDYFTTKLFVDPDPYKTYHDEEPNDDFFDNDLD